MEGKQQSLQPSGSCANQTILSRSVQWKNELKMKRKHPKPERKRVQGGIAAVAVGNCSEKLCQMLK